MKLVSTITDYTIIDWLTIRQHAQDALPLFTAFAALPLLYTAPA